MKRQIDFSESVIAGVYFLMLKDKVVYVGQTECLLDRIAKHRAEKIKDFDAFKYISSKTFYWLDDYYFRKYFEQRCIHRFQPEYNCDSDKNKYVSLNTFLMRRHLFNQNGTYVDVVSNNLGKCGFDSKSTKFYCKWINHFSKNGKLSKRICNNDDDGLNQGYDQFFRTLDLTKKIYVDGKSAFHELVDVTLNEEKKKKREKFQRSFKPLTKKMHN